MEGGNYNELWSDCIPTDILGSISSRLVAGDYFAFRAVCKKWRFSPLQPPHPPRLHDDSPSPCLLTLRRDGIAEFFHPVYNAQTTHKTDIPKLKRSLIRSAKGNWLLMSHDSCGMFFFNPISNDIIELPDLLEEHQQNYFPAWTFSCPPDSLSSDCFVIGFKMYGSPPAVYIIKVGETRWTYHDLDRDDQRNFWLQGCNNPVFFRNNRVYVLGDEGNLGILSIKKNSAAETPVWKFYGKPFSRQKQTAIRKIYTVEDVDNEGMLAVFLTHEEDNVEVWRYKINGRVLRREKLTSLDNKTLFVSLGASYLKSCVARGLENKIYFPMFHDNKKGVFYCLRNCKYFSFDYSVNKAYSSPNILNLFQPRSCIWIEPEND